VVRLTQVFRQAAQSAIVTAAHQINTAVHSTDKQQRYTQLKQRLIQAE
jgi:ATP-dependent exoDNAse (exonuclease V) alpha subunit